MTWVILLISVVLCVIVVVTQTVSLKSLRQPTRGAKVANLVISAAALIVMIVLLIVFLATSVISID